MTVLYISTLLSFSLCVRNRTADKNKNWRKRWPLLGKNWRQIAVKL